MALIKFNWEKKMNLLYVLSIVWGINFRLTFKEIGEHMDFFYSFKNNCSIILVKNICCTLFLFAFILEYKRSEPEVEIKTDFKIKEKKTEGKIIIERVESCESLFGEKRNYISLIEKTGVEKPHQKVLFFIKTFFLIIISYSAEEAYFLFANNHILDRITISFRNTSFVFSLILFSYAFFSNKMRLYQHQIIPLTIIIIFNIVLIFVICFFVPRVKDIFDAYNLFFFILIFIFLGLETVANKYLIDQQFISIYLILFLKGLIGTIVFCIIKYVFKKDNVVVDNVIKETLVIVEFDVIQKISYIISFVGLQLLKLLVIKNYNVFHLFFSIIILDILYFPFYVIERLLLPHHNKLKINNKLSFSLHSSVAFISVPLMLVFIEVLELNFLGLNTNIKKNIDQRIVEDKEIKPFNESEEQESRFSISVSFDEKS